MLPLLEQADADDNLRFLVLEVRRQLERTHAFLLAPTEDALKEIRTKDDYIDNLRNAISRKCFQQAAVAGDDPRTLEALRNALVVAANLENMADYCEALCQQYQHVGEGEFDVNRLAPFVESVLEGLARVETAVLEVDVDQAVRICRVEVRLDELYAATFVEQIQRIEAGAPPRSQVTAIFIAHYFERMGDALQNIGEAVLSAALGEKIKIGQFRMLEQSLEDQQSDVHSGVSLSAMAESRSGCRIDVLSDTTEGRVRQLVFKQGHVDKLSNERDAIRRWHELSDGVAPRVLNYRARGDQAGLLLEYLPGVTLESLAIEGGGAEVRAATAALWTLLERLWTRTLARKGTDAGFVDQIRERLPDVIALHPEFATEDERGVLLNDDLETAERLSRDWYAPFSVQIHGDLNTDNVLYDAEADRVYLIDLHRTRPLDYVQDVSVLLVSLYRMRVLKRQRPRHVAWLAGTIMERARTFADQHEDDGIEFRMGLGMVRSLITSTRFVLDPGEARRMFDHARRILSRLLRSEPHHLRALRLPETLFHE